MSPTAHDPYSPHPRTTDQRPWRSTEPAAAVALEPDPVPECRICAEALERGAPLDLPAHEPAAHIGGPDAGVVTSRPVTPDEGGLSNWDGSHLRQWWEDNLPDGVELVAFYGDEYTPRVWIPLPDEFAAGMLANGATGEETQLVEDRWQDGTDETRAGALLAVAEFTPEDWAEFVQGWRAALESGILTQETDDDDQTVAWLPPLDFADPPEVEAGGPPEAATLDLDGQLAEALAEDLPVPEGHQRVSVTVGDPDDPEGATGVVVDVPEDHEAALAYLAGPDDGTVHPLAPEVRARLVLAAELTRQPSRRRKSLLAAITETLGAAEVAERQQEHDTPPGDGG